MFTKKQHLCHSEIIKIIIKYCLEPEPNWIKFHLFGIFIDKRVHIFAYYPNTFEPIANQFFKQNQHIAVFRKELDSSFEIIKDFT